MHKKIKAQQGRTIRILLFAIAAFTLGIAFYSSQYIFNGSANLDSLQKAVSLLEQPRELPTFKMTNQNGLEFSNKDLKNTWSFIFFGFTNCPDICPITLSVMDQVSGQLDKNISAQNIFISVDPERDKPEKIKEYVAHFNNKMVGLTGNEKQINTLTQNLGAIYSIQNSDTENYMVDHSAHIFVIAPNGKLAALFSTPHDVKTITDDFKIISQAYNLKQQS